MISTSEFHNGLVFEDEGQFWEILQYQHHRKSQSAAVYRTTLRSLQTGNVVERSYASGTKFREVPVTKREKIYSYDEGANAVFMDQETYDQVSYPKEKLGGQAKFLQENMEVLGVYVDGKLTSIELPANVVLEVSSTVPGVKGDSVSNMTKPATLSTGLEIAVPLFVKEGDKIRVDTRTSQYVERVKA
ncbi:MAG: elongation factor P [Elusimicrobia bacterium]|nr:elongation factor P [Elusimicrobiota bacterium]MDE2236289.1 elongation factor P [Elusimicrobiota bacterium]MDE2424724.1 elongation factor P [Elusimicrobiota bacterium]